jgi:hypothetical protein
MCFKEATLFRPIDRFKMEAAYEKDKVLTRSLEISAAPLVLQCGERVHY